MSRLDAAYELVSISSVSRHEAALAAHVESILREVGHLDVERVGDNVVARTLGHHAHRVIVAGHLDTVPGDAGAAVIEGDVLRGVGACDMKGSLAVMLELAGDSFARAVEVTWIFYAREEVDRRESGLLELAQLRPDLLDGDAAILAEPSGGAVEAGCQGTLRAAITLLGSRAHTARPHTGRNAIHRLAPLLDLVASYRPREVVVEGVAYTEQLQAVRVEGGVANNVVPDEVRLKVNVRVAPGRDLVEVATWLRDFLAPALEDGDEVEVEDWAPGAAPALANDRLAALVALTGRRAIAKVGWTDVATFAELGVAATNYGAGDPLLAHRADEFVTGDELDEFARVLRSWLAGEAPA